MNRSRSFLALVIAALALSAVMRSRRESVAGRVVCITGGSRGLGLQIAREAAKRGAKVAVLARSQIELDAARDDLRTSSGAELATTLCDVRNRDDVSRAIAHVVRTLGPIDVLVNVAGIISVGPFEALTYDDFTKVMATNFYGQLNAIFEVLPAMRARRDGRIVNVNSIGGRVVVPHLLPYCASKFAAYALSEGLRMEVARDGVAVTTVVPGLMRTGSPPRARFAGRPKAEYAAFAAGDASQLTSSTSPMPRVWCSTAVSAAPRASSSRGRRRPRCSRSASSHRYSMPSYSPSRARFRAAAQATIAPERKASRRSRGRPFSACRSAPWTPSTNCSI